MNQNLQKKSGGRGHPLDALASTLLTYSSAGETKQLIIETIALESTLYTEAAHDTSALGF